MTLARPAGPAPRPRRRAGRDAGLTISELVVACGLGSITSVFAFTIYARVSNASRSQERVAEVQQAVRTATDLIVKDVRQAGYMIATAYSAHYNGTQYLNRKPLAIANDAYGQGDDRILVAYGDPSAAAHVRTGSGHSTSRTRVDRLGGLLTGDVILGSVLSGADRGKSCVLEVTSTDLSPVYVYHRWTTGSLWNQSSNTHCDPIRATHWPTGNAMLALFVVRAYRIKPDDPRGVLEVSTSGMMKPNDWAELAIGIVDLQVTIRVYQADDLTDADGDGDPERDWYSGDNMNTVLDSGWQALQVRVSVVGRTLAPVLSATPDKSPDLIDVARPDNNSLGDHEGTPLPVTDTSSRHYGNNVYRFNSTIVDLRNLGIGQ